MIDLNIEIPRGNTYSQPYAVKQDGGVFDLTGYLLKFVVKADYAKSDGDAVLNKLITVSAPTTGLFTHTLDHADTDIDVRSYVCEIKLYKGDGSFIETLGRGAFKVTNVVLLEV
jgi:hypothetical protein